MFSKRALALILLCVFLKQLAWQTFMPIWQTPDEQAHFAQVSIYSETSSLYIPPKNLSREIFESEKDLGVLRDNLGNNRYTYHPEFNITYSLGIVGPKESKLPKNYRTSYVKNEAASYPPAYYLASAPFYLAFTHGSIFDRVFSARLLNALLMVALALVAYKIGQLLFPKSQSAGHLMLMVAFFPMLTFVFSGVTSDTLFILLFTLFLWRCLVLIHQGLHLKNIIIISAVIIVAFWTKPQANIMAFIVTPLVLILLLVDKTNRKFLVPALLLLVLSVAGIGYRISQGASLIPESTNALNLSPNVILEHLSFTLRHTYREVLPWFWGVFRWLSLGLPELIRKLTNWLTLLSLIGFTVYIFHQLKTKHKTKEFWMVVFLVFALLVYFASLSIFDFGFRQTQGYSFGIQGRYFFPVIIPIMTIFLIGLRFGRVLSILMILFNIFVFFWLAGSYYQFILPQFFLEASQYKPYWLKFPVNAIILLMFIISSTLLVCRKPNSN